MVKRLSTMQDTWVRSLGWEDSLEKEMATYSSTLTLKIPWMEELGAGYCPWGCKELGTTERLHFLFTFCIAGVFFTTESPGKPVEKSNDSISLKTSLKGKRKETMFGPMHMISSLL